MAVTATGVRQQSPTAALHQPKIILRLRIMGILPNGIPEQARLADVPMARPEQ